MTQVTTGQPEPPSQPPAKDRQATDAQRSMLRRVLGELVLYWSARVGLVWVAVLTLGAVFAPFFASSHPILMKTADTGGEPLSTMPRYEPGSWSSPLLRHLAEPDVLLPILLIGVLVVVCWRGGVSGGRKLAAVLAFGGLVVVLGLWQRHLGPFVSGGQAMWLQDWYDWREGVERTEGVPPRAPVGPFVWWVLLWVGLVLMLVLTAATSAVTVMQVASRSTKPVMFWPAAAGVLVGVGAWVWLVDAWGIWAWLGGLVAAALAMAAAMVYRARVPGRVMGVTALAAGLLIGGWLVHAPVTPPRLPVLEQYRDAQRAGEIDWALHTPIPYSPEDTLADSVVNMRFQRPGMHPMAETVSDRIIRMAERATSVSLDEVTDAAARRELAEAEGEARVAMAAEYAEAIFEHFLEETPGAAPARLTRPRQQIEAMVDAELQQRLHVLGTTAFGADLAANMIHGTRIALSVGFISTGIAIVIGLLIGGFMGYFSGIVDLLGMRLVEMFSAIPTLFLLLAFVAAFGANLYIIMIIIGLTSWVGYAVFIRAEFLRLRQQEFIQAAQALGLPLWSVLLRHLLPNGVAPMLVAASFGVASAIGFEATLSFLGIGLDTESSWGLLLEQALRGGAFNWWIAVTPGLAIFLTVFAYILIGEALRDAIDPKTQSRNT